MSQAQFKVYGADGCSYCVKAKDVLKDTGFEYVDIGMDNDARMFLKEELKVRTIPQVFHGDKHIGGYTELVQYLKEAEAA